MKAWKRQRKKRLKRKRKKDYGDKFTKWLKSARGQEFMKESLAMQKRLEEKARKERLENLRPHDGVYGQAA